MSFKKIVWLADITFLLLSAAVAVIVCTRCFDGSLPGFLYPYIPYYLSFFVVLILAQILIMLFRPLTRFPPGQFSVLVYLLSTLTVTTALDGRASGSFSPLAVVAFLVGLLDSIIKISLMAKALEDTPADSKFKP